MKQSTQGYEIQERASIFLKKYGLYVVVGLCALCVGIAALVRFLPGNNSDETTPPAEADVSSSFDETLASLPTPTAVPDTAEASTPTSVSNSSSLYEAPTSQSANRITMKAVAPVQGDIIWGYAADSLLYSKTLELWTTHEGIDIAAQEGSEVHAFLAGTVSSVTMDDALGVMVTIEHDGGLVSVYANLKSDPPVQEGQLVDASDVIGYVGSTSTSECGLASHLHFGVLVNGSPKDPGNYVLLNK